MGKDIEAVPGQEQAAVSGAPSAPPETFDYRLRKFAGGRCGAARVLIGENLRGAAYGWKPRVAGRFVINTNDPRGGFVTRNGAIAAAHEFRESCRRHLAALGGSSPSTPDAGQTMSTNPPSISIQGEE